MKQMARAKPNKTKIKQIFLWISTLQKSGTKKNKCLGIDDLRRKEEYTKQNKKQKTKKPNLLQKKKSKASTRPNSRSVGEENFQ